VSGPAIDLSFGVDETGREPLFRVTLADPGGGATVSAHIRPSVARELLDPATAPVLESVSKTVAAAVLGCADDQVLALWSSLRAELSAFARRARPHLRLVEEGEGEGESEDEPRATRAPLSDRYAAALRRLRDVCDEIARDIDAPSAPLTAAVCAVMFLLSEREGAPPPSGREPDTARAALLRRFFRKQAAGGLLTEEQAVLAFGAADGEPGVLQFEQTRLLFLVSVRRAPESSLAALRPGGALAISDEQMADLSRVCGLGAEHLGLLTAALDEPSPQT
jgi:hypothetical protein